MFEKSTVRQPRGAVKINGTLVDGFTEFECHNNTYYEADTFRVSFPARALPVEFGIDKLIEADALEIELLQGYPVNADKFSASELESWIVGNADEIQYDPIQNTVTLSGRDFTSKLIDEKTTEKWPNKTASEIATLIAQKHALTPIVTKTTEQVGIFYEIDHVRVDDIRTEWDLLNWLAGQTLTSDGRKFKVYTKGKELHFEPSTSEDDEPYELKISPPQGNTGYTVFDGKDIQFSRSLTVLKDVVVQVKSWNTKSKTAHVVSYPKGKVTSLTPGESETKKQLYTYSFPGLSNEQALQRAQALYADIVKHQVNMSCNLPGDNALTPQRIIKVSGTGTRFDQIYFPDSINRSFTRDGGYTMSVSAKNHSPESQVTL